MTLTCAVSLGLFIWETNIAAQKIDGLTLVTYEIVIAQVSIQDKLQTIRFFKETFLVANISIEVILGMLFLLFNNVNIRFAETNELT